MTSSGSPKHPLHDTNPLPPVEDHGGITQRILPDLPAPSLPDHGNVQEDNPLPPDCDIGGLRG